MLTRCYEILFVLSAMTLCLGCGQKRVVGPAPDMVAARELRETLQKEAGAEGKSEEASKGTGWASLNLFSPEAQDRRRHWWSTRIPLFVPKMVCNSLSGPFLLMIQAKGLQTWLFS